MPQTHPDRHRGLVTDVIGTIAVLPSPDLRGIEPLGAGLQHGQHLVGPMAGGPGQIGRDDSRQAAGVAAVTRGHQNVEQRLAAEVHAAPPSESLRQARSDLGGRVPADRQAWPFECGPVSVSLWVGG